MKKIPHLVAAVAIVVASLGLIGTHLASATQLPPGQPVIRFDSPCVNQAQYSLKGQTIEAYLRGDYIDCGRAQSWITLVFFDPTFGLLNVACQRGDSGPSGSGLGYCFWDGLTEFSWFDRANTGQVPFGMTTEIAPVQNGHSNYIKKMYSAFG